MNNHLDRVKLRGPAAATAVAAEPGDPVLARIGAALCSAARIGAAWRYFLCGFVLLLAGFLIGPRVAPEYQKITCIGNVTLAGPFGFGLNCDSPEFMWLAREPSGLLRPDNPRQSRPGLVIAASLLQAPLSVILPADAPPQPMTQGLYDPPLVTASFSRDLPAYAAYLLLNAGFLLFAFRLLQKIVVSRREMAGRDFALIVASSGLLLVANDVTKAFFWSPHTQMLNVLVPVLAAIAVLRILSGGLRDRGFAVALGLGTGFGITAYPVFCVVAVCLVPPALFSIVGAKGDRGRQCAHLGLILACCCLPSLLWYGFVISLNGSFFQFEMKLGQVVWMADAWANGPLALLREWFAKLFELLGYLVPQAVPLAVFTGWIAAWLVFDRSARSRMPEALPAIVTGLYVSAAMLGFYTCVGWIVDRLAYPALPPLIVAAGAVAYAAAKGMAPGRRLYFAGGSIAIAAGQMIFEVAKHGPWS